jgi:hypothetical protein
MSLTAIVCWLKRGGQEIFWIATDLGVSLICRTQMKKMSAQNLKKVPTLRPNIFWPKASLDILKRPSQIKLAS